jgi:hypothetical protein
VSLLTDTEEIVARIDVPRVAMGADAAEGEAQEEAEE